MYKRCHKWPFTPFYCLLTIQHIIKPVKNWRNELVFLSLLITKWVTRFYIVLNFFWHRQWFCRTESLVFCIQWGHLYDFYGNTTTVTWLFCNAKQFTCLAQMTMLKYAMTNIFTNHIPSCLGTHWSWWLVKQYWLPSLLDVLYLYARTWWAQVAT